MGVLKYKERILSMGILNRFSRLCLRWLVNTNHVWEESVSDPFYSASIKAVATYEKSLSEISRQLLFSPQESPLLAKSHPLNKKSNLIVSVCLGTKEKPKFHNIDLARNVDWQGIIITDDSNLIQSGFPGWSVVSSQQYTMLKGRLGARFIKTNLHEFFGDYEKVLWIDASVHIWNPKFLDFVRDYSSSAFACLNHPVCKGVDEELLQLKKANKISSSTLRAMKGKVSDRLDAFYPETTVMLIEPGSRVVKSLMKAWNSQLELYEMRDQPALAGASQEQEIDIHPLFGDLQETRYNNDYFVVLPHSSFGFGQKESKILDFAEKILSQKKNSSSLENALRMLSKTRIQYCQHTPKQVIDLLREIYPESNIEQLEEGQTVEVDTTFIHVDPGSKFAKESLSNLLIAARKNPRKPVAPLTNRAGPNNLFGQLEHSYPSWTLPELSESSPFFSSLAALNSEGQIEFCESHGCTFATLGADATCMHDGTREFLICKDSIEINVGKHERLDGFQIEPFPAEGLDLLFSYVNSLSKVPYSVEFGTAGASQD